MVNYITYGETFAKVSWRFKTCFDLKESKQCKEPNIKIRANGVIDVNGSVVPRQTALGFKDLGFKKNQLPVKFGTINGDFDCHNLKLETLKGAPKIVNGDFNCSHNLILSRLEYCPKIVTGHIDCSRNLLYSLEDLPKKCTSINVNDNMLTSLEHFPNCKKARLSIYHTMPLLRLLKLDQLEISSYFPYIIDSNIPIGKINRVLNKWIDFKFPMKYKIISCQYEMIQIGLGEYASW